MSPGHTIASNLRACQIISGRDVERVAKQIDEGVVDACFTAITRSKIKDALDLTSHAGSRRDAAEQIIRAACIKRSEIDETLSDPADRARLYPFTQS